ncbi:MAG: hypothetical protein HXS46_10230 [Theionarchaea archaeon]|nr:MAG: hypothetical protein AYK18_05175 [Theionarchaea archaeon DG-70]MBU7011057.1 hypothetical protein [Theionarchaea archaeon]
MTPTICIKEETKKRLNECKTEKMTYDDVLNYLMDTVAIEDISEEDIKEYYRRLETFDPVPKDEFKKMIKVSS